MPHGFQELLQEVWAGGAAPEPSQPFVRSCAAVLSRLFLPGMDSVKAFPSFSCSGDPSHEIMRSRQRQGQTRCPSLRGRTPQHEHAAAFVLESGPPFLADLASDLLSGMPEHLSPKEVRTMDALQKQGKTPQEVLAKLQAARAKRGAGGPSANAVYRFMSGETYERGRAESRGRPEQLCTDLLVKTANAERRKLIRAAGNEYVVTWEDVHAATQKTLRDRGVLSPRGRMCKADWLSRLVREQTPVRERGGGGGGGGGERGRAIYYICI